MKRNKACKTRPLHPFPLLAHVSDVALIAPSSSYIPKQHPPKHSFTPTKKVKQLSKLIEQGARVLLDIKAKRALIYDFAQGLRMVCEISIRMLSSLLKTGQVIPVSKQQHLVHYAFKECNRAWYKDPETCF